MRPNVAHERPSKWAKPACEGPPRWAGYVAVSAYEGVPLESCFLIASWMCRSVLRHQSVFSMEGKNQPTFCHVSTRKESPHTTIWILSFTSLLCSGNQLVSITPFCSSI